MKPRPLLLAVPNASEGADRATIEAIAAAFDPARLLDLHSDPDHGRSVFTLAGAQGELSGALARGAAEAFERIDLRRPRGVHPHVGALDVMPVVYLAPEQRGSAIAEALTAAALVADECEIPVFLYGPLATDPRRRERADLRRGGLARLSARILAGELAPDFGPARADAARGAMLATARPPLAAFNVELACNDLELAQRIASRLREAGGGLPGLRALGLPLPARGRVQVSTNIHDPVSVPLAAVVAEVASHAPVAAAEVVGLVPEAALVGFPPDVPLRGSERGLPTIEDALRSL